MPSQRSRCCGRFATGSAQTPGCTSSKTPTTPFTCRNVPVEATPTSSPKRLVYLRRGLKQSALIKN